MTVACPAPAERRSIARASPGLEPEVREGSLSGVGDADLVRRFGRSAADAVSLVGFLGSGTQAHGSRRRNLGPLVFIAAPVRQDARRAAGRVQLRAG
eukprot:13757352-Alexandrium_andersonii.AAC.1